MNGGSSQLSPRGRLQLAATLAMVVVIGAWVWALHGTLAVPPRLVWAGMITIVAFASTVAAAALLAAHAERTSVERLAAVIKAIADGDLSSPVPADRAALLPISRTLTSLREQMRGRLSALKAEEETLRAALDGLSDAVLLFDGSRVRLANKAVSTMFRTPPGDLQGRKLTELGLPAPLEATVSLRLQAATPSTVDLGPDPFHRYHRVVVVPLGAGELGRRTLVVTTDTTDRQRLDAVRRDFVANASHELKTPTTAILLLAESATHAVGDGDREQASEFVSQIRSEAERLRHLVADLLDLSRIESVPDSDDVSDVRVAVELALAGHRRAASSKGLTLAADLEAVASHDVAARCSSTDLAVVLDNLLSNAITYTETGGVTLSVDADDTSVAIGVADTGIGIPPSDVERVFERFYRVDRARSRTSGGTGLGLALVRNIVEKAGGTVVIASELDAGTKVTVTLPRVM